MEKVLKKYSLVILACLLLPPALLRADSHLQTAKKTVIKRLTIAKGVQLSIYNQYGDVVVQSWKQRSALIQVTITGRSSKLPRANELVRFVAIKTGNKSGEISLETAIDTVSQHIAPASGEQCHISYRLFVPWGLRLSVTNRFGNINIKNFSGALTIDEKFGDLSITHTSGVLQFNVEQGNADIDRLRNASLRFKGFDHVRIGELSGTVDAKFSSGGGVDLGLSGGLQKLSINADNLKPLNITNLKPANADLKIHSLLSKIVYNGKMLLGITLKKMPAPDTVYITGKGDTVQKRKETLLDLKKISVTAMKSADFTLKTGSATTDIRIDASFCVVNVKD